MTETRFKVNICQILFWIIILGAVFSRLPALDQSTFHGQHCWKSVRHFQFAQNMLIHHNYLYGLANFNQPELNLRWNGQMWDWIYKITEAPLIDWALVVSFKLFGVSTYNFFLTFITISILTCVALYHLIKRLFGEPLALLGLLLFSTVPLYVYFSQTGLGENAVHSAIILFAISIIMVLDRLDLKRYLFFLFTCFYSILCKGTTGGLLSWLVFSTVHLVLAFQHRDYLRGLLARRKAVVLAVAMFFILINLATLYATLDLFFIHTAWPLEDRPGGVPAFFVRRAMVEIGLPVLVPMLAALAFYLVRLALAWKRGEKSVLSHAEITCLILLGATYLQFLIQFRPANGHQFYQTPLIIPSILIALAMLHRFWKGGYHKVTLTLCAAMLLLFAWNEPQARAYVRYCYKDRGISDTDEQAVSAFFKDRLKTRKKYFVFTFHPVWAYYAGTLAVQVGDWDALGKVLLKNLPENRSIMKRLGIEYIVFPTNRIPKAVLDGLKTNPVASWGANSCTAQLSYRGDTVCVFQIQK